MVVAVRRRDVLSCDCDDGSSGGGEGLVSGGAGAAGV